MHLHAYVIANYRSDVVLIYIQEAQDAVATLMKQKKDDAKIGRLLSQFVIKRHGPSVGTELTTDELLSWEVWPNFIELSGMVWFLKFLTKLVILI